MKNNKHMEISNANTQTHTNIGENLFAPKLCSRNTHRECWGIAVEKNTSLNEQKNKMKQHEDGDDDE